MTKAHDYVIDPDGEWSREDPNSLEEQNGNYGVETFVRDVIERRNGVKVATWHGGSWQVRGGGKTRTFIGESAWSSCAREADDRRSAIRFAR